IRKGQTLLVRGATAAVGLASVVYAKTLAVRVVATTRSEQNTARLREVGADITLVDDGQIADDVRRAVPEGVDAALEVVGAATVRVPSLLTRTFDFDQVPRAHAFMESDRALGKIVVRV